MEDLLQISNTDLSMQVLYYLFHPLLELLVGPNPSGAPESLYSQTFSYMFYIFNSGLIFLAGLYILLNSTMALLKTIDEGQVLGRSWSTTLVPLRLALGFAVLLPLNTGYSLLQSGAMWVGIQGIGLANSVYSGALERMTQPADFKMMTQAPSAYKTMLDVYHASSCTYYANQAVENQQLMLGRNDGTPEFGYTPSDATITAPDAQYPNPFDKPEIRVVSYNFGNTLTPPGDVTHDFLSGLVDDEGVSRYLKWVVSPALAWGASSALNKMEGARSIYQKDMCGKVTYQSYLIKDNATRSKIINSVQTVTLSEIQNEFLNFYLPELDAFVSEVYTQTQELHSSGSPMADSVETASYFFKISQRFDEKLSNWIESKRDSLVATDMWRDFIESQIVDGWMSAGTIYYAMVQINDRHNGIAKASITSNSISPGDVMAENVNSTNEKLKGFTDFMTPKMDEAFRISRQWANSHGVLSQQLLGATPVNIAPTFNSHLSSSSGAGFDADDSGWFFEQFQEKLAPALNTTIGSLYKSIGYDTSPATSPNLNFLEDARTPILVAQEWGRAITLFAVSFFALLLVLGLGSAQVAGTGVGSGIFVMASGFTTIILVTLAFFGLTLAYYIPMVPFITWLGALASLFLVFFEMLIVANIWGITWLSPEGEGFTGRRAEQGWLLVLNVFLSPVLMVFGLFIAAALAFAVFAYINAVFFEVFDVTQYGVYEFNFIAHFLGFIASVVIYAIVSLSLISVIYSLIWQVRDNVLRWLGSGAERLGDMGVERENRTVMAAALQTGQRGTMSGLEGMNRSNDKPDSGGGPAAPGRDRT